MYAQLRKLNGSPGYNSGKICCLETKTETVSFVHCHQKPGNKREKIKKFSLDNIL